MEWELDDSGDHAVPFRNSARLTGWCTEMERCLSEVELAFRPAAKTFHSVANSIGLEKQGPASPPSLLYMWGPC